MRCAECDEGTLIAELDIMLVGLRTAEFGGLSSSFRSIINFNFAFAKKMPKKRSEKSSINFQLIFLLLDERGHFVCE